MMLVVVALLNYIPGRQLYPGALGSARLSTHSEQIHDPASAHAARDNTSGGVNGPRDRSPRWRPVRGGAIWPAVATASTILVRIATLWFAVVIGVIALAIHRALQRGRKERRREAPARDF